jgi:hypothetical protein
MKRVVMAFASAAIVLLPMQSLAENRSSLGGSEPTFRSGNVGALGSTVNGRTAGKIAAASKANRGAGTSEPSELHALVEAQDKVLEQKLKSICRGC